MCRAPWSWPPRMPMAGAWRTGRSRPNCCRARRARLASLVAEAHSLGLEVALAGALRAENLPVIRATAADIAGVRAAACRDGTRSGPLDAARVRALRAACAA